jgi:hypothetical protein
MAIKIKNMEMPECCGLCPFSHVWWYVGWARVTCPINDLVDQKIEFDPEEYHEEDDFIDAGKHENCPLEEVD